jgi:hypothetical protein
MGGFVADHAEINLIRAVFALDLGRALTATHLLKLFVMRMAGWLDKATLAHGAAALTIFEETWIDRRQKHRHTLRLEYA